MCKHGLTPLLGQATLLNPKDRPANLFMDLSALVCPTPSDLLDTDGTHFSTELPQSPREEGWDQNQNKRNCNITAAPQNSQNHTQALGNQVEPSHSESGQEAIEPLAQGWHNRHRETQPS